MGTKIKLPYKECRPIETATDATLTFSTPLWLISNGIRYSHNNHHLSDSKFNYLCLKCGNETIGTMGERLFCSECGSEYTNSYNCVELGEKDYNLIKRVGFKLKHCYSEDTEVLTENGWKHFYELKPKERICTLNPKTKEVEYQEPINYFAYKHKGKMIHFKSKKIDLLVTDNHKVYVAKDSKRNRKYGLREFELIEAKDILNKRHYHTKRSSGYVKGKIYNKYLMQLVGFFIGDGNKTKHSNKITFHLKKKRKINFLYKIATELNLSIEYKKDRDTVIIDIRNHRELFNRCYFDKEKSIPKDLLFSHKENIINIVYGLTFADGDYKLLRKGLFETSTTSKKLLEDLYIASVHCGFDCAYSITKPTFDSVWKDGTITRKGDKKNLYKIRIITSKLDVRFNNSLKEPKPSVIDYDGMIYCVEVPNHILMVRRNGKIIWSGNSSVLEHSMLSFDVTMSRATLQELSRHRHISLTVKSTRYTLKELKNEEPFYLESDWHCQDTEIGKRASKYLIYTGNDRVDHSSIIALENLRQNIVVGVSNDISKFSLPDAMITKLQLSLNLRELLHIFKLRLAPDALWEFRVVCYKMFESLPKGHKELILEEEKIQEYLEDVEKSIIFNSEEDLFISFNSGLAPDVELK